MRRLALPAVFCLVAFALACGPTLPPATAGGGWILWTGISENGLPAYPVGEINVSGKWAADDAGAAGDASSFNVTTDSEAMWGLPGKRAPAKWTLTWLSQPCIDDPLTNSSTGDVALNEVLHFQCLVNSSGGGVEEAYPGTFAFSPEPVNDWAPPASATITGSGFDPTYGMPLVQYYDMTGTLVAQENASSVSSDGTTIQIPGFSTTGLAAGEYVGFISNAGSGGTYNYLGTAEVAVVAPTVTVLGSEQSYVYDDTCLDTNAGYDCPDYEPDYGWSRSR